MRKNRWRNLAISVVLGAVVAVGIGLLGHPSLCFALGWACGAGAYCFQVWLQVRKKSDKETRQLALGEDPGRHGTDVVLIVASVASVVGVGVLLLGSTSQGVMGWLEPLCGVAAVAASWFLVHTIYTLRYAKLYYSDESNEPIDFPGDDDPDFMDFAYLSFTLGMTYQVSDTDLQTRSVRRVALHHVLLSYFFGAVVLACTINLVASLASG